MPKAVWGLYARSRLKPYSMRRFRPLRGVVDVFERVFDRRFS